MAIHTVNRADADPDAVEAEVRRLMGELGMTRAAAELVVAVERGDAFVGDREQVPPGCRDAVLAEEEAAERACLGENMPHS